MQLVKRNSVFKIIFLLCSIGFIILLVNFTNKSKLPMSPAAHSFNNWMKFNDSQRINFLKKENKQFNNLQELDSAVSYKVKFPQFSQNRKLIGLFLTPEQQTNLLYENGLYLTETPITEPLDVKQIIEQDKQARKDGSAASDKPIVLVKVNGIEGFGAEPGYNQFSSGDEPRPGFVDWSQDGVQLTLFGDDIPLKDLIKIAESFKDVSNKK